MRPTLLIFMLVALVVGVGVRFIQPQRPLLAEASLSQAKITPNGQGIDGSATISFTLNRTAKVTITFTDKATSQRFVFHSAQERAPESYQVLFGGVVDGYAAPDDIPGNTIEARLVPNGEYTWTITAEADSNGEKQSASGTLTVADADTALPAITDFSISPQVFTPNQDGIDDRVNINVSLATEATLTVYLEDKDR